MKMKLFMMRLGFLRMREGMEECAIKGCVSDKMIRNYLERFINGLE